MKRAAVYEKTRKHERATVHEKTRPDERAMKQRTLIELDTDDLRSVIREELERVLDAQDRLGQEWYSLREAAELKGVSYEVLRKRPLRYWPNFGRSHAVMHRGHHAKMFHRSEVALWLPMTEAEMDDLWQEKRRAS